MNTSGLYISMSDITTMDFQSVIIMHAMNVMMRYICGMKGRGKTTVAISPIDIEWFYKISNTGLCINRSELHKIIKDPNMPNNVKRQIQEVFMR
jgi:hypothetical protein